MIVLVSTDFEQLIEQYHQVVAEFVRGDPEPAKKLFSTREDVCLANPFGGIMRGWKSVAETVESAASLYKEGTATFQNMVTFIAPDIAYLVEVEEYKKLNSVNVTTYPLYPFVLPVSSDLKTASGNLPTAMQTL